MNYKCDKCEEPRGIPLLLEKDYAYARISDPSISKNYPCHTLILPKRHVEEKEKLVIGELRDIDDLATKITTLLRQGFEWKGQTIKYQSIIRLNIIGARSEKHYHEHLIPGDPPYAVKFEWRPVDNKQIEELTELLGRKLTLCGCDACSH